jgi:hypothetical protein
VSQSIRVLTPAGLQKFRSYLDDLRGNPTLPPPFPLLEDPEASAAHGGSIENQQFKTRYDFGNYLITAMTRFDQRAISHDAGLWSWLALFFFEQLCPADKSGKRAPAKEYAYVLSSGKGVDATRHYYRHFVRTPYILVRDHGANSKVLLNRPLSSRGELVEQLASRQSVIGSRPVIEAVQIQYYDAQKEGFKRGAAGRGKPGSIDRFVSVVQQLECTYDLHSMTGDKVVRLLPTEFNRWRR